MLGVSMSYPNQSMPRCLVECAVRPPVGVDRDAVTLINCLAKTNFIRNTFSVKLSQVHY
jgi:hypothetical protein